MRLTAILEKVIRGQSLAEPLTRPEQTWTPEYAIWRYFQAKQKSPYSLLDHAVLLRQCLRWNPGTVRADFVDPAELLRLRRVGIIPTLSGNLEVKPYRPEWLEKEGGSYALDTPPSPACMDESFSAEGWLETATGKTRWRSQVQKEGCWEVLQAEPGSTRLIGLPTGAGKSLLFQVAAAFSRGLTVVIVPTVALGLDQLASARKLPSAVALNPQIYCSQDGAASVRDAVINRECRLLFTSPEACVSGRLRAALDRHAEEGWLEWVVVDEAHIVESWGADFRIEFQLLGALVREWREKSRDRLKTLLLSATFAGSTTEILRRLFVGNGDQWKERVVQRLRPEIHYHFREAPGSEEQKAWVMDALLHLPRPMILYVTEQAEAEAFFERARAAGLQRVACFHGDTEDWERARIMNAWREDSIDLMVATSAFGMGVDKPDVRCVMHACFPESIDRFYQEVGRGGRDGASTQSVMIYTAKDKRVGHQLTPTLLLPETITERWAALWGSSRSVEGDTETFQVKTDSRRGTFVGRRTYRENVRWNKRLLQMLHRGGLLSVAGLCSERIAEDSDQYQEWATITNLSFPPMDLQAGERLADQRDKELEVFNAGFAALERCAAGAAVCCELKMYYGGQVARACGSCAACRSGREERKRCGHLIWPEDSPVKTPRVYVVPMSRPTTRGGRPEWILALRRTINEGVANRFVTAERDFEVARMLLREASGGDLVRYRLDLPDDWSVFVADERIVALHISDFAAELAFFNQLGRTCSHWIPKEQVEDRHGRSRFTQENGARPFDTFETWLHHTR